MSLATVFRLFLHLYPLVVASPFYAAYGLFVIVRALVGTVVRAVRAARVLHGSLRCPQGHEVPLVGRFACASCHSEYLGNILACATCGATADLTRCPTCATGVRLPTWGSS